MSSHNGNVDEGLRWMLEDLGEWRLDVTLKPAPEPAYRDHKVRAVTSLNPLWYQDLCARCPGKAHPRRPRSATAVRRRDVVRVLKRLLRGHRGFSKYEDRLVRIAASYRECYS